MGETIFCYCNAWTVSRKWRGNKAYNYLPLYLKSINQESSFKYWPNKGSEIQLRNFTIETTSEDAIDKDVIKRSIKITHKQTVSSVV